MAEIPHFMNNNNGNNRRRRCGAVPALYSQIKEHLDDINPNDKVVIEDNDTLMLVNILRNSPTLVEWVKSEFFDELDEVRDVWINEVEQVTPSPLGEMVLKNIEVRICEPVNSEDFAHIVYLRSSNINLLKYINFELDKKLIEREKLNNIFNKGNGSTTSEDKIVQNITNQLDDFVKSLFQKQV